MFLVRSLVSVASFEKQMTAVELIPYAIRFIFGVNFALRPQVCMHVGRIPLESSSQRIVASVLKLNLLLDPKDTIDDCILGSQQEICETVFCIVLMKLHLAYSEHRVSLEINEGTRAMSGILTDFKTVSI